MRRIRVMVVDDSVVVRRVLSDVLGADPDLEVVAAAANGSIALAKLTQVNPDIITLDVEMPDMNGLDLLDAIHKVAPAQRVIMFSSLTERAGANTLEALARGATDYVTKPSGATSREAAAEQVRSTLIPRIKTLARSILKADRPPTPLLPVGPETPTMGTTAPISIRQLPRVTEPVEIIAVGASTGGPNALAELFKALPGTLPVPMVIVQHMPPLFTRLLAERLTANSSIRFHEAAHGDVLVPGEAWIAPGDFHMKVVRDGVKYRVVLDQGPPQNSCRPAVDALFTSVASVFGPRVLAMVLTGMGQDGLVGCKDISARGGQVVVQDAKTSVVWGMPGFVARAGIANAVRPLPELPMEILKRVPTDRALGGTGGRAHAGHLR